jgi:hypothetical protein
MRTVRPAYVAGGFVRAIISGEEVSDVDIFTDSRDSADRLAALIGGPAVVTDNAITLRSTDPVTQIIYRWVFNNLEECIDSFDFTIAKAGITYKNDRWVGLCDPHFYQDLAAKRLRYTFPDRREDEAGSMLRLLKFYAKGYRAPLFSIAGVIARAVKGMDADGNEARFAEAVQRRLRVVDPAADPEEEGHLG